MKIRLFLCEILLLSGASAIAYQCPENSSFTAIEQVSVEITVDHLFIEPDSNREKKSERVCATEEPLRIGVFDIRGREEEWYYCFYRTPRPALNCRATYNGTLSDLIVRPAIVIRSYPGTAGTRDTHAHIFLAPGGDQDKYKDTFVRSMSLDLKKQDVLIDSVSGGQGPESDDDSFGVRLHFH